MSAPNPRLIGSTDVAAVLGLSKYRTAWDVWQRIKHGVEQPIEPQLVRGLELERPVAQRFAAISQMNLAPLPALERPHGRRWQRCSFDFEAVATGEVVECKTANEWAFGADWGPEPAGVPLDYQIQVQTQLEVTRRPAAWVPVLIIPGWLGEIEAALADHPGPVITAAIRALVPVFIASGEVRIYRIERDQEMGSAIVAACDTWWRRHIEGGEEPVPGVSSTLADWLKSKHPRERDPLRDASAKEAELILAYEHQRAEAKAADERKDAIAAQLRVAIGDAAGIKADVGVATYKAEAPRMDWKAACSEMRALLGLHGVNAQEVIDKHRASDGARKLTIKLAKYAQEEAA